ncbi:ferritin-like domain-containing protein [Deinococcus sp. 14RED07]|uniref:ferritin-like domain-containing protein n=1 Tax=unclassified Deinococcus TaxID=2623546 RepID=UPI001E3BFC62|nr:MULTISPECIES: ferritin-like domain-containing protein [unclassified Deinococcus]MCD0163301.1 ferritin-like domain-containing protein [Deinococcus sp. 6YEL10]MCD0167058.1 ferritin-like domain-containing protein [Deinococcus sp. 12RED42]MCD0176803.1 ferritin-like domain-containing protein [Deinococcus sp. 14RED07]
MPDDTQITSAVNSTSRRQFMGYAALFGGGMALVSCGVTFPELTAAEKQDIDILNYALTLEYLEAEFYAAFVGSGPYAGKLSNPRVIQYAREIAAHEASHVEALKKTIISLRGTPVAKPTFDFSPLIGNSTVNDQLFLQLAAVLEPVGVRAYLGQVARLSNPQLIAAAAAIHAVEANHVSAVQELRVELRYNTAPTRQTDIAPQSAAKPTSTAAADFDPNYSPTPTAFWKALTMAEVLAIVKPVIK